MAILEILKFPDPRLRKKSVKVETVTPELKELAKNMLETMYTAKGIGLAAPQVGELVRLIVLDTRPLREDDEEREDPRSEMEQAVDQPLILFNPEIVSRDGKKTCEEGCLSVPTYYETVERADYIELKALNENGEEVLIKTDGLLSVCLQHEMDHLDGKLFIDRLSMIKANRIKNKVKKYGYEVATKSKETEVE